MWAGCKFPVSSHKKQCQINRFIGIYMSVLYLIDPNKSLN